MIGTWRATLTALALFFGTAATAWAQNAIQSINSSQQAGADVVRIELSEPLAAVPNGFAVQTPPRVAIDLPGVGNALGKSNIDINQGNLRSVNVAQSGDRTRLVLNLRQPANYKAQLQGKVLLLVLESSSGAPPQTAAVAGMPAEAVRFAENLNRAQLPLRDIDFRRGPDGAGRVVVDLPNNQVGVDIRQQGQSLVVEFMRSTLPDSLRRRLDVTDFGTPVHTVSAVQSGDRVRLVVEPRGAWEHSAYQSDNQFVLEVRPQKIDPNKLTQGPGYSGEKLSLNFQNIEVRALLQVIADFTNFNVVTSDSVTGNVTLRLKDVPWDQALDIILQAKGLGLRKSGNVIWIAPKDELAAKEKLDLESKVQIAALEPVRTQSFQLNYTKAEEVAKGLTGQSSGQGGGAASRILSPRGSVIYETRTNQLFVSDIPSKLEEIQSMITKIDIPVRQVLIEARIVIADDKFGRSLGVKLGGADLRGIRGGVPGYGIGSGNNRVTIGGNMNAIGAQTQQTDASDVPFNDTQFINLPATGQSGFNAATFALSLFGASSNRFLNLEISALEADGKGKVVSSPRVITADQVKALIEQGEELPYQTATSSGATALQFRKANLRLEVTPQITPEGNVILDVDVNKDSVGRATAAGFAIDTKHVKTQVLVENGGTVVIGGIFEQTDREDITKVPFLGDVPYLGNLFKNKTKTSNKTELLIFITPKVVSDRTAAR
ncbi:type IV pilus secretin PilQ [Piscinibacter sp.]|uniref:type IV pilus secretin PilQ n=1 Tax=Piscinibacter sp. TaxID=1903157 RepID=UPI002BB8EFED|nr:type IV pilus secretin PilQ [Albitalea sp.]HUG25518.1 type IV pilus secretin PilQ [Albitalea sp.]